MASVAGLAAVGFAATAASADQLLTGSITSATGQKLEGVQVSAKKEGSTITTSVYTDQNGEYIFPPLADGKYRVWAQALGFQTAKGEVDLAAAKHHDFKLARHHRSGRAQSPAAARDAGCGAAGRHGRRRQHQEDLHQRVHRLPHAGLSAAVQVRRSRLEQDHQPDEGRSRLRRLSGRQRQGKPDHRV